jgi:predicted nucleotidyltransferase
MAGVIIRASVLANAQASLGALDGVEAIYLSGSLAEGTEDRFSDIDLRVVVTDPTYESALALREQLPTTWGPFLFHETVGPNFTVSYYESLTKVDVFYYRWSEVAPSAWFNIGTRILLDRTGALATVIDASRGLKFEAAPGAIMSHLVKALAGLIEGAKRLRRDEPIYASRLYADAIYHLLVADDLLSGRAPIGSSKRERLVSDQLTDVARAAVGLLAIAASDPLFSRLAASLRTLVSRAQQEGHCSQVAASRLFLAIDQMTLLAAGR